MLELPEDQELVVNEIAPEDHSCLPPTASDAKIDQRIKMGDISFDHLDASCSIGKVIDAEYRINGI